ncbi:class I SAM-dependent methyltransferase [Pseudaquidulcibacter saccharophilus]|uniref:class I SAM-dependent methyltransferase n=1 Tax=Pseudaquidulcibacter saccharophilus TaxID=2831900 RepID=UPI001EFF1F43|nr:class I SAM-dependent methyltransferase [Pseudaquidulcibacter saccharophilus]
MDDHIHWDGVYNTKQSDSVSWFQETPRISLDLIGKIAKSKSDNIIDVGSGASKLIDELEAREFTNVSILDISQTALNITKKRLVKFADCYKWLVGDITKIELPKNHYKIWHDRAVFHFLTEKEQRQKYISQLTNSIAPNGNVIIATFSLDGPKKCSGLDIVGYSALTLAQELGNKFTLIESTIEQHHTPSVSIQEFIYCNFKVES